MWMVNYVFFKAKISGSHRNKIITTTTAATNISHIGERQSVVVPEHIWKNREMFNDTHQKSIVKKKIPLLFLALAPRRGH